MKVCSPDGRNGRPLFEFTNARGHRGQGNAVLLTLFKVMSGVSLATLAVHIVIFSGLKKLRTQPAQNLLALACALFVAQLLFLFGLDYSSSHSICIFIATLLHYFILVAFFWLNVLSYDIYRLLARTPTSTSK